ncbi:MAG: hypothetical protein AABN95_09255 [Acidobacteriota bacterium]
MSTAATFLLFAVIVLAASGCAFLLRSSCENTVRSEIKSPDGKYVVTLFERNCGATTDFSTIVSLRDTHELGNALGAALGLPDPFGGYAAQNSARGIGDPDVGAAFENCVFGGLVGLRSGRVGSRREFY